MYDIEGIVRLYKEIYGTKPEWFITLEEGLVSKAVSIEPWKWHLAQYLKPNHASRKTN